MPRRRGDRSPNRWQWGRSAPLALIVIDPPTAGAPWCPSALLFGVACPLCGLTRGVASLVRGDVESSIAFHPMAWMVLLVAALAWAAWLGRRTGWWSWRSPRLERWVLAALVFGLVATWLVRGFLGNLPPI